MIEDYLMEHRISFYPWHIRIRIMKRGCSGYCAKIDDQKRESMKSKDRLDSIMVLYRYADAKRRF